MCAHVRVHACSGVYTYLGGVVCKESRVRIQRPFALWVAPRSLSFLSYKIRAIARLCSLDSEGKAGRSLVHEYQAMVLTTSVCMESVVRRQVMMMKAFFKCFIGAQETPELLSVTAALRGRHCYCNPHLRVGKLRLREISMG